MFSVYGVAGQSFRGSLEKLIAIPELGAARRSRGPGQAPVLDKTLQLIDLVSTQDLLTVINVEDGRVRDILPCTVANVMTTPVVSEQAERVGILPRSDILRALVNDPPLSLWT